MVFDISQCNTTYAATTISKEGIIDNQKYVLSSFGLSAKDDYYDLIVLDIKITQVSIQYIKPLSNLLSYQREDLEIL